MKRILMKSFEFSAAHCLPNHAGKCKNMHGHTWKLEVYLAGDIIVENSSPARGMIVDFKEVKTIVNAEIIEKLDHKYLNEVFEGILEDTTAENLSEWIYKKLNNSTTLNVVAIKLWEAVDSASIYCDENFNFLS